ncbi:unnamed protein product [Prunus armeniaca]|uniref:VWFA domain-containing protein n=1 Tax=Prunus armeniaca TaxID=36596 RepID=A0A6J5Y1V2_PRUAR|nr:unnamed protein product [Prunus armeniaca]
MAEEFSKAVDDGLKLSKRLYFGKDRAVSPPKPPPSMDKTTSGAFLPTAPMVYAVIFDPAIVDNPDIPSYQPHVHGRCDPAALIPLPMNRVELEVDCYMDTAFVRVTGSWRVHCVKGNKSCGCRVAIPMGEQGSILGVEVDVNGKSYHTQLSQLEDEKEIEKMAQAEGGFLKLKPHIFTLTTPQVNGGANLSIKMSWSQKILYENGDFSLNIPFTFPEFVVPAGKKYLKKEKIHLNVNSGIGTEVLSKRISHPLKELRGGQVGKLGFVYGADVLTWSNTDFSFSYVVSSSHIHGAVLVQSPPMHDVDQREIFSVYLLPGNQKNRKVFRKDVAFVVDISGSMKGKPLDDTKSVLSAALSKLDPEDSFCIIAFNGQTFVSSTSMKSATKEAVEKAIEWIGINLIAGGDTDILTPLNQAIEMLSNTRDSIPIIFLVTDGAVEDERHICDVMKKRLTEAGSIAPRICTFGIGSFCNHYFLWMLAMIGRGHYDAAYDVDFVESRMQNLFIRASSLILTNITLETLDDLDEVEVFPSHIPDLSSESPLTVSGRFRGSFPNTLKAKGLSPDMSSIVIDLKLQDAKDIPLDMVCAKGQIELLTAQAWLADNKQLEDKVAKLSIQSHVVSEYTRMIIVDKEQSGPQEAPKKSRIKMKDSESQRPILLPSLSIGFGNLVATSENIPPGSEEPKQPEAAEIFARAASNCCGSMCTHCCCMGCIKCFSRINPQCANVFAQLCTGLACAGCLKCCSLCCRGCGDGGS